MRPHFNPGGTIRQPGDPSRANRLTTAAERVGAYFDLLFENDSERWEGLSPADIRRGAVEAADANETLGGSPAKEKETNS